uniref:Isoprenylcysteine carboxyl methyltransferase (ICMT) family protein n=1 Tax=Desulfovibrio sp. U5L TaxID=596152 RepID=I2Q0F8_9BACT
MANTQTSLYVRTGLALVFMAFLLFVPAGTLAYWQAWVYWLLFGGIAAASIGYFSKRDPALLERRSSMREKEASQKCIMAAFIAAYYGLHAFAGLDRRFGWSTVPTWLVLVADLFFLLSFVLIFFVLRANSFASSTITVEKDQPVITTGPYALVRHPMYAASLPMLIFLPLALGTAWGLFFSALMIGLLVPRLLYEERFLRKNLPGYEAYCRQTRFRLLPGLW